MRGMFRIKSSSKLAMAAALGLVVSGLGLTAVPAYAAKGGGNSKPFVEAAMPLQKKVEELEAKKKAGGSEAEIKAGADALRPDLDKAMAAASTNQDKLLAGQFGVTIGGLNGDLKLRQKGAQMMVDSGQLKPEQVAQFQFYIGNFAYGAGDFPAAATALKAAADAGFQDPALVPLLIQAYGKSGRATEGLALARSVIDAKVKAGQPVPEDWLKRANAVAYEAKSGPDAIALSTTLVDQYPSDFNWLSAAQVVRTFGQFDPAASLDLFRLMDRSGALNSNRQYVIGEYKEYIETADPRKNPGEVVALVNKGMQKGILQAGDTWATEAKSAATGRVAGDKASLASLMKEASAGNGKTAIIAGDVALNYGQAADAEKMYAIAANASGVDQNLANTRLGIAQYDQKKFAEAKASFAKVTGPRQTLAKLWTVQIDNQGQPAPAAQPAG